MLKLLQFLSPITTRPDTIKVLIAERNTVVRHRHICSLSKYSRDEFCATFEVYQSILGTNFALAVALSIMQRYLLGWQLDKSRTSTKL